MSDEEKAFREMDEDDRDEYVHDFMAYRASSANNGGVDAQVELLKSLEAWEYRKERFAWTPTAILIALLAWLAGVLMGRIIIDIPWLK